MRAGAERRGTWRRARGSGTETRNHAGYIVSRAIAKAVLLYWREEAGAAFHKHGQRHKNIGGSAEVAPGR